jgi:hypothetical protein
MLLKPVYTKKLLKKQFATSGDVYSLQSGEAQFEIINKT